MYALDFMRDVFGYDAYFGEHVVLVAYRREGFVEEYYLAVEGVFGECRVDEAVGEFLEALVEMVDRFLIHHVRAYVVAFEF